MRPFLLVLMLLIASGCAQRPADDGAAGARLTAVATTGPVGDALRRLAGEQIDVSVLMGPGVDPHLYKEKPSDLRRLDSADLIVHNGLHLEGRLADVLERLAEKKHVVAMTGGLEQEEDPRLISPEGYESIHDPHVWHDASLWSDCVRHLCDRLCEFDPEHAGAYRQRSAEFRDELALLDEECRGKLAAIPDSNRVLVTAHDAFAYFSRAYGLRSVGLKGVSTEDEVDLGRMTEVVDLLIQQQIPAVFVETAVAPKIVEALVEPCAAQGHEVRIGGELYADALGPVGSGAEDYLGMLRSNAETIADALAPTPAPAEASP